MPFVKVVKSKAYFKRFQVQYRRRREGKTDYHARRQMVLQDKTKFGSPKYRLVVRFTNRDIVAQVVQAKIGGDKVVCAAYAHELPVFGIQHGLTNYAAAYATGLLLARRTLTKMKIADKFPGVKEADGTFFQVRTKKNDLDDADSPFSFKAILDVGLARTTTGARIFGVLKGAVDGGMAVPHSDSRFPGYKDSKLNTKVHRDHIFGKHVADYLKLVKEELSSNPDEQLNQFSKYIKDSISPDSIEGIYKKAHAAIRADPCKTLPKKAAPASVAPRKYLHAKKQSAKDRKAAAKAKVASIRARLLKS